MSYLPTKLVPNFVLDTPANDFVAACYKKMLGRDGDPGGVAYYASELARRRDRLAIAADIAASDEAMFLPVRKKREIAQVLAAHAYELVLTALTRKQKRRAAARVQRYMSVLTGFDVQESGRAVENDPFARYLREVIEDQR